MHIANHPPRRELAAPRIGINTSIINGNSNNASPSPTPVESQRPRLSVDVAAPPVREKRLPSLPSPHQRMALGAYDNKLVSSTLSQLPPLPPLSPSGVSSTGSNLSSFSHASTSPRNALPPRMPMLASVPRPAPPPSSTSSMLILPDGTKLPATNDRLDRETMGSVMGHSSPSSPWSLLTVHVLPLFTGSPLKTPIEDLNQLCNQHIINASQRAPGNRLLAILNSDLRDFVASGMLTLKGKFETIEETKVVSRAAEVWNFFWGQILPYVEGVFLPFSQVRIPSKQPPTIVSSPPIPVRHILLSAFLVHILLPLLPRLIPLVAAASPPTEQHGPGNSDLPRLLQMSLVLSTQARYSSFIPNDTQQRDEETRESVEELARAVRWAMVVTSTPVTTPEEELGQHAFAPDRPARPGLQRGPSVSQAGRLRRRGTLQRSISQLDPELTKPAQGQWGRPRIDEDDEDDRLSTAMSTLHGGESVVTLTDQRTPVYRRRRDSSGESDLTSVTAASNR